MIGNRATSAYSRQIPTWASTNAARQQLWYNCGGNTCPGASAIICKVPLILSPQPEGGYTVTSPLLPELITEGDTVEAALENVRDALAAVVEGYVDMGRPLPAGIDQGTNGGPVWLETLVATP